MRDRLPIIIASAQTGYAPLPELDQAGMVYRTVKAALGRAGVGAADIDTVISSSDDVMDGRSISSVFLVEAMAGFLKEESKVEEDGTLALFYAALRMLAGASELALVVASSKASECDPAWYAHTTTEPFFHRPLGLDDRIAAGIQAQAYVDARGLDLAAIDAVTTVGLDRAAANPHALRRDREVNPPVAGPLRTLDLPPRSDGCCCLVLASPERARTLGRDGARIAGMGTATDGGRFEERDLATAPSATAALQSACAMAGLAPEPEFDLIEQHAPSSVHELLLLEALGQAGGDPSAAFADRRVNPSGGALGADAVFVGGLARVAECAARLGSGQRGLAHGRSGLFCQTNTVFVLERAGA